MTRQTGGRQRLKVVQPEQAANSKLVLVLIGVAIVIAGAIGVTRAIDKRTAHRHDVSAEDARAIQSCSRAPLDAAVQLLRDAGARIDDAPETMMGGMPARVIRAYVSMTSLNAPQIREAMPRFAEVEGCGGAIAVSGAPLPVELPGTTLVDSRPVRTSNVMEVSTVTFVIPRVRDEGEK